MGENQPFRSYSENKIQRRSTSSQARQTETTPAATHNHTSATPGHAARARVGLPWPADRPHARAAPGFVLKQHQANPTRHTPRQQDTHRRAGNQSRTHTSIEPGTRRGWQHTRTHRPGRDHRATRPTIRRYPTSARLGPCCWAQRPLFLSRPPWARALHPTGGHSDSTSSTHTPGLACAVDEPPRPSERHGWSGCLPLSARLSSRRWGRRSAGNPRQPKRKSRSGPTLFTLRPDTTAPAEILTPNQAVATHQNRDGRTKTKQELSSARGFGGTR